MLKKIKKFLIPIVNISIFSISSLFIVFFLWNFFGKNYVFGPPVGGDYYNALTYLLRIIENSPLPPSGWFSLWNEGAPFVGSYPFLVFYLLKPFASAIDPIILMNYFSFSTLVLFFIFSLLLFWQVSKNWFVAIGFTFLLAATAATYYQLTTGGFIISASAQFYLPLVLALIYRFGETKKNYYLILSSIICGLSLLHQAPSTLLMVFAPALVVLFFLTYNLTVKKRIYIVSTFTILALLIGAVGLYTVILQTFGGSGTGKCTSPQCWGDYPTHLIRWFAPLPIATAILLIFCALLTKVLKKSTQIPFILPSLSALFFLVAYCAAAYFKHIDGLANVLFPTRTFWAINLLILTTACASFFIIKKTLRVFSYIVAILIFLISILYVAQRPLKIHKDFTATLPQAAHEYAIGAFKTRPFSDIFPDWVIASDKNWRIDISNSGINQWYSYVFQTPSTRGYSNHPIGTHREWQYFLEISTRNVDKNIDQEITKNKTLFLLDAFGVGIFETSQSSYPPNITNDPKIIVKKPVENKLFWWQLSTDFTSPIVTPTNTPPILFVGNEAGYNSFIRSLAMVNLNSKILIPIKGPKNINDLTTRDLKNFKTLVLYQYEGNPSKLINFVKSGGRIFIEQNLSPKEVTKLPEIFPVESQNILKVKDVSPKFQKPDSDLTKEILQEQFSPLTFENGPWKLTGSDAKNLRPWAKTALLYQDKIVLSEGQFSKGYVIFSGLNLPFHIVQNQNLQEAKLLKTIIERIHPKSSLQPTFKVTREKDEVIEVSGENIGGIYFKENYHKGWVATVNGESAKVYKAGLDFMYIKLPKLNSTALSTKIIFRGDLFGHILFYLTSFSLLLSIFLILTPKLLRRNFQKIVEKASPKLKEIFTEEEG